MKIRILGTNSGQLAGQAERSFGLVAIENGKAVVIEPGPDVADQVLMYLQDAKVTAVVCLTRPCEEVLAWASQQQVPVLAASLDTLGPGRVPFLPVEAKAFAVKHGRDTALALALGAPQARVLVAPRCSSPEQIKSLADQQGCRLAIVGAGNPGWSLEYLSQEGLANLGVPAVVACLKAREPWAGTEVTGVAFAQAGDTVVAEPDLVGFRPDAEGAPAIPVMLSAVEVNDAGEAIARPGLLESVTAALARCHEGGAQGARYDLVAVPVTPQRGLPDIVFPAEAPAVQKATKPWTFTEGQVIEHGVFQVHERGLDEWQVKATPDGFYGKSGSLPARSDLARIKEYLSEDDQVKLSSAWRRAVDGDSAVLGKLVARALEAAIAKHEDISKVPAGVLESLGKLAPVTIHTDFRFAPEGEDWWEGGEVFTPGNQYQVNELWKLEQGVALVGDVKGEEPEGLDQHGKRGGREWLKYGQSALFVAKPGEPGATKDTWGRLKVIANIQGIVGAINDEGTSYEFYLEHRGQRALSILPKGRYLWSRMQTQDGHQYWALRFAADQENWGLEDMPDRIAKLPGH